MPPFFFPCFPINSSLKKDLSTTPRPLGNLSAWIFPTCTVAISKDRFRSVRGKPNGCLGRGGWLGCKRSLAFPKTNVWNKVFQLRVELWLFTTVGGFFFEIHELREDSLRWMSTFRILLTHRKPQISSKFEQLVYCKCQVQMHVSAHYRPFAGVGALVLMMYDIYICLYIGYAPHPVTMTNKGKR